MVRKRRGVPRGAIFRHFAGSRIAVLRDAAGRGKIVHLCAGGWWFGEGGMRSAPPVGYGSRAPHGGAAIRWSAATRYPSRKLHIHRDVGATMAADIRRRLR